MGSPFILDVGPILSAGRPTSLDEQVEVPPFSAFTLPRPAHVLLDLRRVDRGLQIDGTITVDVAGQCDRCLDDVVVSLPVEVDERFGPDDGSDDPLAENNVLDGTRLDVSDLVRQLVQSALPYGLTCSPECRGLCDRCGRSKNDGGGCTCPPMEGDDGEPQMEDTPLQDA